MQSISRKDGGAFHPQVFPTIQRYNTANRRAMLKNLEILEKRHSAQESHAELETAEQDTDGGSENEAEILEQEPSETPANNPEAERSATSQSQSVVPDPEASDGNSVDTTVAESESLDQIQERASSTHGDTAA
jgi:hypothetical protein